MATKYENSLRTPGSVAVNRELAQELAPAWSRGTRESDRVVRRYELEPFLVRDSLTETRMGRSDILHPEPFHQLLCRRIASDIVSRPE